MEPDPEIVERLCLSMEKHSPALREALHAALTERTFPLHPRFKGRQAPVLDEHDVLCGVHVEYGFLDWVPIICGLSRAAALKCGARYPFGHPFGPHLASLFDSELDDVDPWLVAASVEVWITAAWRAVRAVAPELRGYVSIHDTIWRVDMDTSATVQQAATGLGWL